MKKYHYTDGTNSFGPFTLEELLQKGITADSYVWYEGLNNWTPARNLPEFKAHFAMSDNEPYYQQSSPTGPPPLNPNSPNPIRQGIPPKNYLLESIICTLFCCLPAGIVAIVYASRVESLYYAGNIQGAQDASSKAKTWMIVSASAFIILTVGTISITGLGVFLSLFNF